MRFGRRNRSAADACRRGEPESFGGTGVGEEVGLACTESTRLPGKAGASRAWRPLRDHSGNPPDACGKAEKLAGARAEVRVGGVMADRGWCWSGREAGDAARCRWQGKRCPRGMEAGVGRSWRRRTVRPSASSAINSHPKKALSVGRGDAGVDESDGTAMTTTALWGNAALG